MSKLTVIIPTKNQKNNLVKIVTSLKKSLNQIEHQIFISNNSDSDLDKNLLDLEISHLKTPEIFHTAEEHIFWAVQQISGEYVWLLGDDDFPIENGVKKLAEIVNQGSFDCLTFNGTRSDLKGNQFIKMINYKKNYRGKLQYFYEDSGLINGPASISLYVTRTEFLSKKYMREIQDLNAPIYSHLTFFLRCFRNANFAYFPIDIIQHSKSDKQNNKQISSNWANYANNSDNFYYFPWTLGLLRNISYLIKNQAIKKEFLSKIIETNPKNKKYQLISQIENYIRLIFVSEQNQSRRITRKEIYELRKLVKEIPGFSEEIYGFISANDPKREILRLYPHVNPKQQYWQNQKVNLKYKFFVFFKQMPKDIFWISVTKLWRFTPKLIKPFLKKLR